MATITAKDVQSLRQKTGLGMMECKRALEENEGNIDAAVDALRKKGLAKMDGRSDRTSAEGRIAAVVNDQGNKAALVEVRTETDFTAKNDAFVQMTQKVAELALQMEPGQVQVNDAMQTAIDELRLTTKENVQFHRGQVLGGPDSTVGSYVHFTGKIGVIVELTGQAQEELLKDLCMHISAATPTPIGVRDEDIPEEMLQKEREIAKGQAMEQGKPENIAEKMVEGKIRKYLEDHVLPKQKFVKDEKLTIAEILPEGVAVAAFVRYQLG